jgi:hypothetical protein
VKKNIIGMTLSLNPSWGEATNLGADTKSIGCMGATGLTPGFVSDTRPMS